MEETIMPSKSTHKRSTATDDVAVMAQDPAPAGDTAPVSAPVASTPALPPSVPHTAATRGLWAALVAQPGSTAASLADAAGISRPTAAKALALLEKASLVTRTEGGREGSKRLPDRWQPIVGTEHVGDSDREAAAAEPAEVPVVEAEEARAPEPAEPEPSDSAEDTDAAPAALPVAEAEQAGTAEEDERTSARSRKPRSGGRGGKPTAAAAKTDAGTSRLGSGQLREMVLQFLREHPGEDFSPSAMGKALARSSGAVSNACDRLQADRAVVRTSDKPRKFRIAKS
jgi:hypothetical protein